MPEEMWIVLTIIGYAIIGGGIKYIDQAFDENIFSKKVALMLAIICAALMSIFIGIDKTSAAIFIGIIFGVAISRKIDNAAFYLGITIVLLVSAAYRYFSNTLSIDWGLVALLSFASFVDEVGNDLADNRRISGLLKKYFDDRYFMKTVIAGLTVFGLIHWAYLLAFLAFDIAYTIVTIHPKMFFGYKGQPMMAT